MSVIDYSFGLICEGKTDQTLIESIIAGWTGNKNLLFPPLQPKPEEAGGWTKVFKYCESIEFKQALGANDFIVIQIDTDFMDGDSVGKEYRIDLKDLNEKEKVVAFQAKIIELIGEKFYKEYSNRIIFAIAVSEIECWLLPIYFPNKKTTASKTTGCIGTLNQVFRKEGFTIDPKAKGKTDYTKLAKNFRKKKDIQKYAKRQESFQLFIDNLQSAIESN